MGLPMLHKMHSLRHISSTVVRSHPFPPHSSYSPFSYTVLVVSLWNNTGNLAFVVIGVENWTFGVDYEIG
jgi:hypothetical protein